MNSDQVVDDTYRVVDSTDADMPGIVIRWPPRLWDWKSGLGILFLFIVTYGVATVVAAALQVSAAGGLAAFMEMSVDSRAIPFSVSVVALLGNIVAGAGSVLFVGVLLKKNRLERLGFCSWQSQWTVVALGLSVGLGAVRGALAASAQALFPEFASLGVELLEQSLVNKDSVLNAIIVIVLGGLVVPVAEELFFRGFVYNWMRKGLSQWPAMVLSALVFGGFHLVPVQVILAFVLGLGLAWIYEKSESLWPPIILHLSNNIFFLILAYLT